MAHTPDLPATQQLPALSLPDSLFNLGGVLTQTGLSQAISSLAFFKKVFKLLEILKSFQNFENFQKSLKV